MTSPATSRTDDQVRTWRIELLGTVQGVGVRPRIARLAAEMAWNGFVRNSAAGVEIFLSLPQPLTGQAAAAIIADALGNDITYNVEAVSFRPMTGFVIDASQTGTAVKVTVPRDSATCGHCQADARNETDRRYRYPFTSCVDCGPRYSIVKEMPYDRIRSTLSEFPLCEACQNEYQDPENRRFHAQSLCCPRCGPRLWCADRKGRVLGQGDEACRLAVDALRRGEIIAVRGVGGYQLLCDATLSRSVAELRRRKQRPLKPFAVLCRSLEAAERLAFISDAESSVLASPANPIVLLRRRHAAELADAVCLDAEDVGVMLPTTPLHQSLAEAVGRPLVCTSGNREGDPLESHPAAAEARLSDIADLFLHHDRDIAQPVDDSVVRVMAGRTVTFRMARGMGPLPVPLKTPPTIGVGGHAKSSIALSNGVQSVLGPHVGDLASDATRQRWLERLDALTGLYGVPQPRWVWDAHPDYFSTRWAAGRHSGRAVWHHHAHVAACAVEHRLFDREVLGIAFDGTGLGPDGSIWGGEILLVHGARFRRVGHLRRFALVGGEAAVHDVRRLAAAMSMQLSPSACISVATLLGIQPELMRLWQGVARSPAVLQSSSCGRLFDAVSALALDIADMGYDGRPAMLLEAACDERAIGEYRFAISSTVPCILDWRPVIEAILYDRLREVAPGEIAMRFHRGLASAVIEACGRYPDHPVVLSGGVFQNRRLVEEIVARWPSHRSHPVWPCVFPPNDGGLAVGQLAIASVFE